MTREETKEYLEQILKAYNILVLADADYKKAPFPDSDLPAVLCALDREIQRARRAVKYQSRNH